MRPPPTCERWRCRGADAFVAARTATRRRARTGRALGRGEGPSRARGRAGAGTSRSRSTISAMRRSTAARISRARASAARARGQSCSPTTPSITDSLGWAYFRRGDVKRALPLLERAARAEPADATINEHLGDAYWSLGGATRPATLGARRRWSREGGEAARLAAKIADGPSGDESSPHRAKLNLALHVRARARGRLSRDRDAVRVRRQTATRARRAARCTASFTITGPFAAALTAEDDNLVTARRARRSTRCSARSPPLAIDARQASAGRVGHRRRLGGRRGDAARAGAAGAVSHRTMPGCSTAPTALGSDVPACLLGRTAVGRGGASSLREVDGTGRNADAAGQSRRRGVDRRRCSRGWDGVDRGAIVGRRRLGHDAQTAATTSRRPPAWWRRRSARCSICLTSRGRLARAHVGFGRDLLRAVRQHPARSRAAARVAAAQPDWWRLETALA